MPPKSWFLWRGGSVAAKSAAVGPALRRVHEVADALGRGRLVQEAEDHAFGDERRELVLVVAAAGDDDREVRKLRVDVGDQVLGVVVGERGIDEEHRIAGGDHEVGRVRRIVGAPDTVNAGERLAQQVDEHRIGGEHDDVRAHRARRRRRGGCAGACTGCRAAAPQACGDGCGFGFSGSSASGASSPGRMFE